MTLTRVECPSTRRRTVSAEDQDGAVVRGNYDRFRRLCPCPSLCVYAFVRPANACPMPVIPCGRALMLDDPPFEGRYCAS